MALSEIALKLSREPSAMLCAFVQVSTDSLARAIGTRIGALRELQSSHPIARDETM